MNSDKQSKKESQNHEVQNTAAPEPETRSKPRKKPKARRTGKNKKGQALKVPEPVFVIDDVSQNEEASNLIRDLVHCYTNNTDLPKPELKMLRSQLYKRTASVFSSALNGCVDRIFKKLLASNYFNKAILGQSVKMSDASCQTDISYDNSLESVS